MKKDSSWKILLIFGIITIIVFGIIRLNNDYMDFKTRKCVVLNKLTTSGGYKSSGDFYLVLKEEKGIIFDLIVCPSTFSQSKVGDTKFFNLRDFDIKQTPKNNLLYFFGEVIFGTVGFVFIVAGMILLFLSKKQNIE
jgi:hypothetical protein